MGREVRRVPATWQHPRNGRGFYIPLFGRNFRKEAAEWDEEYKKWQEGLYSVGKGWEVKKEDMTYPYEEWDGRRPEEKDYMPNWSESERTHYQMYETTTEGTPISPVMKSPEELASWLAEHEETDFGYHKPSYEEWLAEIQGSSVPGFGFLAIAIPISSEE